MNKQEFALFVNEINSFTPCVDAKEFSKLSEMVESIIIFSLRFTKTQQRKVLLALILSSKWHSGQYRKNKTTPYILHPLETALFGIEIGRATYKKLISAILHDNVEDESSSTKRTHLRKEIRRIFGHAIADIVALLTKHRHPVHKERFFITLREAKNLSHRVDAIEIKFWDRIKNAETFNVFIGDKRTQKVEETKHEFPILASILTKTLIRLESKGKLGRKADKFVAVKLLNYLSKAIEPHL